MMTKDQIEVVKIVYNRLIDSEERAWNDIDDTLEFFSWLSDVELIAQVQTKMASHSKKALRCTQNHDQQYCMAPYFLEASEAIVDLYEESGVLHEKNRYILTYYMTMSELGLIYPT